MQNLIARHIPDCFGTTQGDVKPLPARTMTQRPRTIPFRKESLPRQPPTGEWKPGDVYSEIKELAHGSEAKTYLTQSLTTGEVYVVKRFSDYVMLNRGSLSDRKEQPRPNEATVLLKHLRPHPNILEVFGCDWFGGRHNDVYSAYCDGGDLADQLDHHRRINRTPPERYVLSVFISLVQALAYIHHGLRWDPEFKTYWREPGFNTPIVHGDIKLDNTFLRWSKNAVRLGLPDVVLGDFGQAQPANSFYGIAGTTGYQAPEVAIIYGLRHTNRNAYHAALKMTGYMTPAADMYSLGQTILMLCTAKQHVLGADPETTPVVYCKTRDEVTGVKLGHKRGYDTEALTKAVMWCLKPDPADRPKATEDSLLDLVATLRKALEEKVANTPRMADYMWASPPSRELKSRYTVSK